MRVRLGLGVSADRRRSDLGSRQIRGALRGLDGASRRPQTAGLGGWALSHSSVWIDLDAQRHLAPQIGSKIACTLVDT